MSNITQPKLTLLVGPAGSGKTQTATEAFENALKESRDLLADDLLFILPTAEHRARIIDLVLRRGLPGFFQRRITTFERALKEFLSLGGFDYASDVTRRMILHEILGRLELRYFKDIAERPGFLELLAGLIVELKEYLISPDEFQRRLEPLEKRFSEFRLKYEDLVHIYQAYEQELKTRNLIDQRDSLRLLEEGLRRGEFVRPKFRHVWIDGFSDFSKLQFSFIEFLTRHSDEVAVTLTLDDDPLRGPLFKIVSGTEDALEDMGFKKEWAGSKNHRAQSTVLQHLERNLFRTVPIITSEAKQSDILCHPEPFACHSDPEQSEGEESDRLEGKLREESPVVSSSAPALSEVEGSPQNDRLGNDADRISADSSIQIFEATGILGEIEMIAREIKRLVRRHAYHFSDIALIFRKADPYVSVIQSVFARFEIPVEIHERLRLKTDPIARILVSLFQMVLGGWSRTDLFNFLKSVCKPNEYETVCHMELSALQKGIFKDRSYWLGHFPDAKILQEIARFEDEFLRLQDVDAFARWVKRVMSRFGLFDFPDVQDEKTRIEREAAKRILLLLEEMRHKVGGVTVSALAEEFLALIDVDLYSVHSRDKNKVQVYTISLARQKEYQVVFLAGLLEKHFPVQVKEDPLLSDAERRALNEHGEILKERLPRQEFERYLFYMGVTRAREFLILTYPRFDLEGHEALPSFYVDEVHSLFSKNAKNGDSPQNGGQSPFLMELPVKKQAVTNVLPSWNDLATEEEAERKVVHALWTVPEGQGEIYAPRGGNVTAAKAAASSRGLDRVPARGDMPRAGGGEAKPSRPLTEARRLALSLYNHFIQDSRFRQLIKRLLEPIQGLISDARILPFFVPVHRTWSPTLLEEYAECPYRFFSHRVLGLESQAEGIDIKRRGTILHDVLEKFFAWMRDVKKGEVSFEEARNFCMEAFQALWEKEPLAGDRFYRIDLERKNMQEMIVQILRVELLDRKPPVTGLVPAYFEYDFQDIILKGETRRIPLRGKIDRIDVDPDRKFALVIDYKTGKKFERKFLGNGTSLQLPFYLIAVREKLGLKPLGGHLYSLSEAKSSGFHHQDHLAEAGLSTRKGVLLSDQEFDDLIKRSIRFAEKFVEGIERGDISVRPRDCVSYCPYSNVCRIEKWRLEHIYREIEKDDVECKEGTAPKGNDG